LVEMDKGGRLIRAIAGLEAILAPPEESFTDPKTGQTYPTPPTIVTQKDRTERDNLPLCIDWGNYSARWLARFNLGLHQILTSLMKGDEVTADDPTLLKMTEIAIHCAAHVKAILGFTIPSDCKPIWLLATLVEQLGLKLTFRKQGKRGQQVKLFSLSKEELEFAMHVIAHRETKRNQKENRTCYAAQTPLVQGVGCGVWGVGEEIAPTTSGSLAPSCQDDYISEGSLPRPIPSSLYPTPYPQHPLLANPNQQTVSTPPPDAIGNSHCQGADTTEFESPPTDRTTLLHCVEMLRSGIKQGVDAIKGILKRWVEDLRWDTVLELEAIAANELRLVEAAVPEFYALLNEEVLPMEG
ncbi:MAG: bifunctional DNA primase/helicase, partial [Nostoc sp.]